jgi:hypothetical protein
MTSSSSTAILLVGVGIAAGMIGYYLFHKHDAIDFAFKAGGHASGGGKGHGGKGGTASSHGDGSGGKGHTSHTSHPGIAHAQSQAHHNTTTHPAQHHTQVTTHHQIHNITHPDQHHRNQHDITTHQPHHHLQHQETTKNDHHHHKKLDMNLKDDKLVNLDIKELMKFRIRKKCYPGTSNCHLDDPVPGTK